MFSGTYIKTWKVAKTVVIPKKNPLDVKKNWRPITLASLLGVMVEKTVSAQLMDYVEKYQFLSPRQHGFRPRVSINTAIASLMNELKKFPTTGAAIGVFIDARNAFGSVPHVKILEKLAEFCDETPIKWFHSFLTDREFLSKMAQKGLNQSHHHFQVYLKAPDPHPYFLIWFTIE